MPQFVSSDAFLGLAYLLIERIESFFIEDLSKDVELHIREHQEITFSFCAFHGQMPRKGPKNSHLIRKTPQKMLNFCTTGSLNHWKTKEKLVNIK